MVNTKPTELYRLNVQIPMRTKRGLDYMVEKDESASISDLVREKLRDMLKKEGVWNLPEVVEEDK